MGKYFGTDGYRGEANVNLTADSAFRVGKFLGWYYGKDKKGGEKCRIVIGKDTRRSSYMFEYAIAAGITATGADAYLLHVTTTPSVAYVARSEDFDCAVMISASHNPYYDNGLKVINGNGEKLGEDVIAEIEAYLDGETPEVPLATKDKIGRTVDFAAGRNRYIGYLISLATKSFKDKKVALDCSNGSASSIAKSVFDALGADTFVIHNEPNGTNINDNCGSTHIESLQKFVVEKGCDVGFAYDGDADRCLAVDAEGNLIDGDQIMYVCGCYMKEKGQLQDDTIVTTVMSNFGLYKALDAVGIKYEKTQVGDRFVYENMLHNGFSLGGEQSGHIIFMRHATTGDGILTSIKVMETMLAMKKSLKDLAAPFTVFPQLLKNVRVEDKEKAQKDPKVLAAVDKVTEELGSDGRILLRASGTEPLVRVMVEADTMEKCEKYVSQVIDVMKELGLVLND
ncbi:phosphoglucosamine mutase [Oribacterium sp. KHPX15]|uniref:phosphoglucosamine mutase n=1 Tax=Oribacterium sp. KHPX15 TaxID=1855342 RepID=UPI00089B3411|nr:phosphoglucosamine mutase [Oribacterium sp. KHPX15]SEA58744.1 phosphoglucosamine mutase [Oribacterium sp. KHPX15]